jgi:uncharacterized protein (DUF58 family)
MASIWPTCASTSSTTTFATSTGTSPARLSIPHVREFLEERDLTAWFLLDLSASVDFGSQRRKREVSEAFLGVMASLVLRHGNRAGAVLYGSQIDTVMPARSGRLHVMHMMQRMRARPAAAAAGATRLADLIDRARPSIRRRSTVFVVSDFISEAGWEAPLSRLAQRHDVVAVRLYDPLEMTLPELGLVLMQDAETGEQLFVDTGARGFRERFEAAAQRREAELRSALARAPASTRWSWPPTPTWPTRSWRSWTRVGSAAAWRPAPFP